MVLYASGTGIPGRAAYGADGTSAKNRCSCTHRLANPSASARSQKPRTASRVTCSPSWGSVSPTPNDSNTLRTCAYGRASIVTVPRLPLTVIVAPSGMRLVASAIDGTHGMPSSRLTMTACVPTAPMSVMTASATRNSGVHDGSVDGAIRMSPGSQHGRIAQVEHDPRRAGRLAGRPGHALEHVADLHRRDVALAAALPLRSAAVPRR